MANSPFAGEWTYRSFHNKPDPVNTFDDLRLGQATLTLESIGSELLSGTLSFGNDSLVMTGTVQDTEPPTVRLRATGIEGTGTAGWIYDYLGYLAPTWPEGDAQRSAIVGTLIRIVPHEPDRQAGYSASFVAVSRDRPAPTTPLPEPVVVHFADRLHRLHHLVWHSLRNTWEHPTVTSSKQARIEALGWKPPRVARQIINGTFKRPYITNGSGEDFLYFHREMMIQFRVLTGAAGQEPVVWIEIPPPGNSSNEIPPAWSIPALKFMERRIAVLKSDEFYWSQMRWWDQQYKDSTYLATLTLGELGSLLEYSVHNDMHMRWAALPRDPETGEPWPLGRDTYDILPKWDNPRYDALLDFYSSHVNPFFWRLHGWIDDRIDDWFKAHERLHSGEVVPERRGSVDWFKPGRWVQVDHPWVWPAQFSGGHGAHLEHTGSGETTSHQVDPKERKRRLESMEQVVAILAEQLEAADRGIEVLEPFDLAAKMPV
jgi:hypothetical protein